MADISAVFHWPPQAFDQMSLEDLMAHHGRALDRWRRMNGIKDD